MPTFEQAARADAYGAATHPAPVNGPYLRYRVERTRIAQGQREWHLRGIRRDGGIDTLAGPTIDSVYQECNRLGINDYQWR